MGLLDGLLTQMATQALGGKAQSGGGGLGGMLGGLMGGNQGGAGGLGGLGDVLGAMLGNSAESAQKTSTNEGLSPKLLLALVPVILAWVQKQGGLENVLASLTQAGVGKQAQSWIGTGNNQAVDSAQVSQIFGADQINKVANQMGISTDEVGSGLASLLPSIINQMTPQGHTDHAPEANQEIGQVLKQLQGMLK